MMTLFEQILQTNIIRNLWTTLRRICLLIKGCLLLESVLFDNLILNTYSGSSKFKFLSSLF